jgi:hypothetical protein
MHEVGALLDARAAHGGRSARSHLLCLAQTNGIGARRVDEVLGIVGLSDVAGKRSKGFSLGMSQRLGVAAALLGDPRVLMFDEPVNGLDPEGILWIRTRGLPDRGVHRPWFRQHGARGGPGARGARAGGHRGRRIGDSGTRAPAGLAAGTCKARRVSGPELSCHPGRAYLGWGLEYAMGY